MSTKTVYGYNDSYIYIGPVVAQESPLEPGVWLMPGFSTEIEPPPYQEGFHTVFNKSENQWTYQIDLNATAYQKAMALQVKNEFGVVINTLDESGSVVPLSSEEIASLTKDAKKNIVREMREPLLKQFDIMINDLVLGKINNANGPAMDAYRDALKAMTDGVDENTNVSELVWPTIVITE